MSEKVFLALSDGTVYEGRQLGALGESIGEVVFNTSMTGYQEVLTDPSYAGQLVNFTYPLIGNYGVNFYDFQSDRIQPTGIIVREACEVPSNWRAQWSLHAFLLEKNIPAIQGIDTRALTKRIRSSGVLKGIITPEPENAQAKLESFGSYDDTDFVLEVSTKTPYKWSSSGKEDLDFEEKSGRPRLVVLDCGLKYSILESFYNAGCNPVIVPCTTSADEILSMEPHGILLSPGPGDPKRLGSVISEVKKLIGKKPMFGICLGNQLLCHAVGGETFKLKFGHRGGNHPVKDLNTGQVKITAQNHGYAINPDSLKSDVAKITQINLNDETVEGIEIVGERARSIQYHPEAAPGPHDCNFYFREFVEQIRTEAGL